MFGKNVFYFVEFEVRPDKTQIAKDIVRTQFVPAVAINDPESGEKRNCSVLVSVIDRPGNPYQVVTLIGRGSPSQVDKGPR